jgi:hypothetical protein
MTRLLLLLLHICAEFLAEATPKEAVEVLIENCPERTPSGAVTLYFAENNGRAKYVSNRVHPGLFITLEVGINDRDVVVYFLQCQAVFWGGKNSLADEGSVR